ncbi:hypothetical protein [Burkholderia gladioli]|uniref:hypothetical protein n=1 Tax=Burkholderia gladioli TaxID=28095 RepID=UPI00163E0C9B|nr:hypothetical protein [Burkholderia gladioli]
MTFRSIAKNTGGGRLQRRFFLRRRTHIASVIEKIAVITNGSYYFEDDHEQSRRRPNGRWCVRNRHTDVAYQQRDFHHQFPAVESRQWVDDIAIFASGW